MLLIKSNIVSCVFCAVNINTVQYKMNNIEKKKKNTTNLNYIKSLQKWITKCSKDFS